MAASASACRISRDWPGGPFGFNKNVHIHHNSVTNNGTVEANAGDSGAGGGVSICSGTDNYLLNFNFICGNFASTDGGGIGHIGVSDGGIIANNVVALQPELRTIQHRARRRHCD